MDKCTECEDEGLGLTPIVFKPLTHNEASQSSFKWKFVGGGIEYCAANWSNCSWLAVQPANSVTGVARMKVTNLDMTLADSSYYFVLKGSKIDMSAVSIELTSLSAGNCTTGTSNFRASSQYQQESEVNEYFDSFKTGSYKAGKVTTPDADQTITRSDATSSGTSFLVVIPVLLVVGAIAYFVKKKKRLTGQCIDRGKAVFGTFNSPVRVKETIATI